jgi:plastocyanin
MKRILSNIALAGALAAGAAATSSSTAALGQTPPARALAHNMAAAPIAAGSPVAATTVQIRDFAFFPQTIVITPGAAVTWTNADDEPHTVTANDRSYHSAALDTDQTYTHTFTAPGEYRYFCSLHPHMTATVIVRAAGAAQGH